MDGKGVRATAERCITDGYAEAAASAFIATHRRREDAFAVTVRREVGERLTTLSPIAPAPRPLAEVSHRCGPTEPGRR